MLRTWWHAPDFKRAAFRCNIRKHALEVLDVVLYNHPTHGFMINFCEVHLNACIYSLRMARDNSSQHSPHNTAKASASKSFSKTPSNYSSNSSEIKLSQFMLPTSTPGAPAPLTITTSNVLLLVSFNGKAMSDFFYFNDLIQDIKVAPEFCRWRFLFYPSSELYCAPSECSFDGLERGLQPSC